MCGPLPYFKYRTFAARRALEADANLRGVYIKLSEGAAEGVAVHAEFFGGFALVSLVVRKDGDEVAALEFAHSFSVSDTTRVHRGHKIFQFAFHKCLSSPCILPAAALCLWLQPIGLRIADELDAIADPLAQVHGCNNGGLVRGGEKIRREP